MNENHSKKNSNDLEDYTSLTWCGLGSWRPQWLQIFASPVFFMINFSLIGIIQGMTGTYFVGSLTTLEKRYAFDSKISGFILIADNFSEMLMSPIMGYLGTRINRPRMIATGEMILSLSCLMTALPYFIYGAGTHLLHDNDLVSKLLKNETKYQLCPTNPSDIDCLEDKYSTVWPAVVLLWMGQFFRGLGFTAYWVIGMPYIDDNVSKNSSPIYISLVAAFRLLGPAGGFLLSSLSLRFYENPFYDPGITQRDPRFIGAWWMGYIVIAILLFLVSLPMFLFPKQFKGANVTAMDLKNNLKGVKGTVSGLKRLIKNPILMFHTIGSAFRIIGLGGHHITETKYIESQYRQTSSSASFLTGTTSILPMAIGISLGGAGITLFKPRCSPMEMPQSWTTNDEFTLSSDCNTNCDCTTNVFTPICSADKRTTYFSPCFAGCKSLDRSTNTLSQCSCIGGYGGVATTGYCQRDSNNCNKLFNYLLVMISGSIISSIAWSANSLLTLRCVDPKDKSFAIGVINTFLDIFALIPYPLIFGAITDSVCLVWESNCGKQGNCWIYDQDKFRLYLHWSALAFIGIGSIFDLLLIFMSNKIKNLYDEPNNESEQNKSDDNEMSDIHGVIGGNDVENDNPVID